jgi:thioester reductase-like protein
MLNKQPIVFVTGATGLVGGALVKLLTRSSPRRFVLLSRRTDKLKEFSQVAGFSVLRGDITCPYFGLDNQTYTALAEQITEIIHCAADTRFGVALQYAREVNTAGPKRL